MARLDLSDHFSIRTAADIQKIAAPLTSRFDIKHFRYLRLYRDGSRVILSNFPDCVRFFYEEEHYKNMWFDGEFPEYLREGAYNWATLRAINQMDDITPLEKEIQQLLGLSQGMTLVKESPSFYELYTFDAGSPHVYQIDSSIFSHFILYFNEQTHKLIQQAEHQKLKLPTETQLHYWTDKTKKGFSDFVEQTQLKRYYLGGEYRDVYLTEKEMYCLYWLLSGKTAQETAIIVGNSSKTVERHFENIRNKLGCYKQTEIARIIIESGLFNEAMLQEVVR